MNDCCFDQLCASEGRHSLTFKMLCRVCGKRWESCPLGGGWRLVPVVRCDAEQVPA